MYDINDLGTILMAVVVNIPEPESMAFAFDDGQSIISFITISRGK